MKILQVVPYYPPHVGGMEFYVQQLSEELAARGHDVTVFTTSNTGAPTLRIVNNVKVCSLRLMTKIYNIPIVPSLFNKLLNEEKADVIHTHQYPVFFSDTAAAVKRFKNTPLLVHVHVVSDAKSPLSGFISNMYYSTIGLIPLRSADSIVVPSIAYKKKLQIMHANARRIQVIPYGINTKKFKKETNGGEAFKEKYGCQGCRVILSVGRLNYQKGFHFLIKAMPSILLKIPQVKLVIVGDGELLQYLQKIVQSMGIVNSVIFTGALSQISITDAYAAADVFVLPSLFESFGISLIEAQASGIPVVATNTGGVPEALVDGQTGILVQPSDVEAIAKAILCILSSARLARDMGINGQKFVESHFSLQKVVTRVLATYDKISAA